MRKTGKTDFFGNARVQTENTDPSETVQSDAHLADITNILKSFGVQGWDILDDTEQNFKDVSDFGDYHDVMIEVRRAEEHFMSLPSKVREIFGHSVETFLDTAHDDDKRAALVEAGFISPPKESTKREKTAGPSNEVGDPPVPGPGEKEASASE